MGHGGWQDGSVDDRLAAKPDGLGLNPGPYMVRGGKGTPKVVRVYNFHVCAVVHPCAHDISQ